LSQRCVHVISQRYITTFIQRYKITSTQRKNITTIQRNILLRLHNVKILPPYNVTFYYVVATYYKRPYFFRYWSCVFRSQCLHTKLRLWIGVNGIFM